MKNSFGRNISVTIFGESHGNAVGCVIDGLMPGMRLDESVISHYLALRRPSGEISTSRSELDNFVIESGVYNGYTTGTPLCVVIPNQDVRSKDYDAVKSVARPSHADYTGYIKYNGYNDPHGGGHFSGRITAAVVMAGAIIMPYLNEKGIYIGTHIKRLGGVFDREFSDIKEDISELYNRHFAVLDAESGDKMKQQILSAKHEGDSVGGVLETAVIGLPVGLGEPFFDSVEGLISHAMFAIPGIKGIEFGAGFGIAEMRGSEANDPMRIENGRVVMSSNNSGGINGGITNGMPVVFRCAVRPTPTIAREQDTVDYKKLENTTLSVSGRHDPCIVHRARAVVDCMTAIVIYDILAEGGRL